MHGCPWLQRGRRSWPAWSNTLEDPLLQSHQQFQPRPASSGDKGARFWKTWVCIIRRLFLHSLSRGNLLKGHKRCSDTIDHLQGSFGPFGPKSEKVLRRVPRASRPQGHNMSERVENGVQDLKITWKTVTLRLFSDFWGPQGREAPRTLFASFLELRAKRPRWPMQMVNDISQKWSIILIIHSTVLHMGFQRRSAPQR